MIIKNFLHQVKNTNLFDKYFYFGEKFIDKEIEPYLNYDNGFFVELGANDGKNQSNTLYFEKFRNWKGVLVEPSPNNYINCLKVRSPGTRVFCNACVSFDFNDKFVEMHYDNLMTAGLNIQRDIEGSDPDINIVGRPGKKIDIRYNYGAIPATLNSILTLSNAPKIVDFLSLDVEGAEIEVLKGVDHNEFRFKYMLIECRDIVIMTKYLDNLDYCFVKKINSHDYLFQDGRIKDRK
jgi:FkbM family methyltransferase